MKTEIQATTTEVKKLSDRMTATESKVEKMSEFQISAQAKLDDLQKQILLHCS